MKSNKQNIVIFETPDFFTNFININVVVLVVCLELY